jgi:hypothetical protein
MWVIVVLAAVFSMHGLQCVTADANVDNASMGSMHGSAMTLPDSVFSTHLLVPMDAHHGGVDLGSAPADDGPAGQGAVHAWAVCFAIAVAGLALLPVLALLRSRTSAARSDRGLVRAPPWSRRAHPFRPPDLAALCLLRI